MLITVFAVGEGVGFRSVACFRQESLGQTTPQTLHVCATRARIRIMSNAPYTTDTSPEAYALQIDLFRQMTPAQRIKKMCGLSRRVKCMAMDAIRRRYPEFNEDEVRLKFIELTYGKELSDDVRRWQGTKAIG